jgi:hypothetical protein
MELINMELRSVTLVPESSFTCVSESESNDCFGMRDEGRMDRGAGTRKVSGVEDGMVIQFNNVGTGIVMEPASGACPCDMWVVLEIYARVRSAQYVDSMPKLG